MHLPQTPPRSGRPIAGACVISNRLALQRSLPRYDLSVTEDGESLRRPSVVLLKAGNAIPTRQRLTDTVRLKGRGLISVSRISTRDPVAYNVTANEDGVFRVFLSRFRTLRLSAKGRRWEPGESLTTSNDV